MYIPKRLVWNDGMTTGDTEVDAQHKYLIDFFNDLGKSIRKEYALKDIEKVLKVMKFYAAWHFGKEEGCMERHHCPIAGKNLKAHAVFMQKFFDYQKEYEKTGGSMELAFKIHEELSDWIVDHIMVVDKQLYPCVTGNIKTDPP